MKKIFCIKDKKGFTLIEMLIVILIIVILLAIAVPSVIAYREDSQTTADSGGAKTVYTALEAALANHTIEVPTVNTAVWWFRDNDSDGTDDEIIYRVTLNAKSAHNELPGANDFLNPEVFTGYYRYGFSTETNSINWVSYHPGDEVIVENSEVMVYDVLNDRTGYLDDLIRTYGTGENGGYDQGAYGHLSADKQNPAY